MTPRQVGLLAALSFLWGASYLLIKYAIEDFEPAVVVFLRTALAAAVLYAVLRVQGGAGLEALGDVRRRPWHALMLGALAITAPFLLITFGEEHVNTGLTAVLIAPASLFVAAFAPVLDRSETITGKQGLGMLAGLAGVALLVGVETVSSTAEFIGAIGILAAAAFYGVSLFVVKGPYGGFPSVTTSLISVGAGALLALPAAAATAPTEWPGARAVLSLLVLSVAGTALAFVIFYKLTAEIGAGRASLVSYLVPPISLTYGAIFLDESFGIAAVVGLVLILGGVFAAARGKEAPPEPAPEPHVTPSGTA